MDTITQLLGSTAGMLTTVAFLPQVIKTWRSRSANDISTATFALFATGVALWLVYGLLLALWPIVVANGVTLVLASIILYFKFRLREPPAS
ncbi:MAG: SemiSWEET transporter [Gammaproteobacteria bacterium]